MKKKLCRCSAGAAFFVIYSQRTGLLYTFYPHEVVE